MNTPHLSPRSAGPLAMLASLACGAALCAGDSHLNRLLHRPDLGSPDPAPFPALPADSSAGLPAPVARRFQSEVARMATDLDGLRSRPGIPTDLLADAALYHKGLVWALRYDTNLSTGDVALLERAAVHGRERIESLQAGAKPWSARPGAAARGYVSVVDGSVQPYGVIVPAGYDGSRPMRLDVVLHGSSKPVGTSELRFTSRFDSAEALAKPPPDQDFIELHPLGRVENCYRWAGETDVFEAIEAVCRNYRIDRKRIVLRGMSMGASGTWHLGLKHPDEFVALGPYCGYVDTHRFSETAIPGFIRVGPLPPHQELGLHLLDSVDYAANATMVPAIAAIGDRDVFFQAHVIMGQALAAEGLPMVNLISPGTGHVIDPVTHAEQMRRIGEYAAAGLDPSPRDIRFVTWSLKYNRCHWLEVLALAQDYARAEFVAHRAADGTLQVDEPRNITRFALAPSAFNGLPPRIAIAGKPVRLPGSAAESAGNPLVFELQSGRWRCVGRRTATGKGNAPSPGLQGPIDDAFTAPFVCVRGTGRPWNPSVQAWAEANLRRFQYEWARYMRGDLPVVDDTRLSEQDLRTKNVVLFGDPGSNLWIRRALGKLPLKWSPSTVRMAAGEWPAQDHAPVLIAPNPLPGAQGHYLVLNSGHTFHEAEFAAFNYLLFPRLGDYAVAHIPRETSPWSPRNAPRTEEFVRTVFWRAGAGD